MDTDYRACPHCAEQIRKDANVCRFCNQAAHGANAPDPDLLVAGVPKKSRKKIFEVVGGLVLIVAFLVCNYGCPTSKPPPTQLVSNKLFDAPITVAAGRYDSWTITIPPDATNATLRGTYHASGGGGADIMVAVASQLEFENWVNGHNSNTYYASPGQVTNGSIDLKLNPGTYVLGFSNRFSVVSNKEVKADLTLQYYVPQVAKPK